MHNNYYFLKQISAGLAERLKGFTLVSCFSQSKDELVIEFNDAKTSFLIRASLLSEFSCLMFPGGFHRAKKNSVDLFGATIMKKVRGVRQFTNERSFEVLLDGDLSLIFKMHGNRSNVLFLEGQQVVDIFKRSLENDRAIIPEKLDRGIDWSKEAFVKNIGQLDKLYFTFGKTVWTHLRLIGFNVADVESKWAMIQEVLRILESPKSYFVLSYAAATYLSLLKFGTINGEYDNPFEAINHFAPSHARHEERNRHIEQIVSRARQQIKATGRYIQNATERLAEIEGEDHFKVWGDILMANLHRIEAHSKSVQLENLYDNNRMIDIPLDQRLTPQKNAERYYRKSKNRLIEIMKLKDSVRKLQVKLGGAEVALALGEKADPDEVQAAIESETREQREGEAESIPFWQFEYKGFFILAGKDAKNNDELTMKWAHKNDLWLHARDVPGSHVIIRQRPGKPFPKDVIEYAASIAAWNSKRKTESLCPVIVTPRKFVRKRKGDPAGTVVVDREEVILVEPRNPS